MALIHATGDSPPMPARGAVMPPPTRAAPITAWICAYAGFRSFRTYVSADVGRSHCGLFGSFQIAHRRTHE